MNLTLKLVAFMFIAVLGFCVFLAVGSIVGKQLPFSEPGEFNWWAIQSGSVGLFVAAVLVGPFLVVLFNHQRWLAALLVTAPVLFVNGTDISLIEVLWASLYLFFVSTCTWVSLCVLTKHTPASKLGE